MPCQKTKRISNSVFCKVSSDLKFSVRTNFLGLSKIEHKVLVLTHSFRLVGNTFQLMKNKQTFVKKLFGNPLPPIEIFYATKLNPLFIKYSLLSLQKDPLIPFHHSQTVYEHSNDVSILIKQLKKDSLFQKHSE